MVFCGMNNEIVKLKGRYNNLNWTFGLSADQVLYAEQEGNYAHIHLVNGFSVRVCIPHDELVKEVPFLFRVHRSYSVNMDYVIGYHLGSDMAMSILFSHGKQISFCRSAKYAESFVELFGTATHE